MLASALAVALLLGAPALPSGHAALESFAHALASFDGMPRSQKVLRRLCARHLTPAFRLVTAQDFIRWQSIDGDCLVEIRPSPRPDRAAAEIRFGCRFASARQAEDFLRNVVIRPMQPPLPDHFAEEMHHRGVIAAGGRMVGAEFNYFPDGDSYRGNVAFTDGWRIVLPLEEGAPQ